MQSEVLVLSSSEIPIVIHCSRRDIRFYFPGAYEPSEHVLADFVSCRIIAASMASMAIVEARRTNFPLYSDKSDRMPSARLLGSTTHSAAGGREVVGAVCGEGGRIRLPATVFAMAQWMIHG